MTQSAPLSAPVPPELPAIPKPRKWRTLLLGVVILLCGMLIGSGATVVILHRVVIQAIHNPEQVPARIAKRIGRKLKLTQDQTSRIRAILLDRQKALLAIRREVYPRVDRELQEAKEQVAATLDPAKAKAWNERFEHLRGQWMPPPPAERE
jgi:hypothetical protein